MEQRSSIMNALLFLVFTIHQTSAVTHSLQYFYTAVTQGINFPEFTVVGQVDGQQFMYYDSKIRECGPKVAWIEKVTADLSTYWNRETQNLQATQETFKVGVDTLMGRFNQTKGVHVVQWMYGCELHDDGTKTGYMQFGYDGEDFISLDQDYKTWIAPTPQALISKHKKDAGGDAAYFKNYLENECIEWIQKYVSYGRDTLERKVRPEVSLFQKDSSSPLVCHATGFFPKAVMISWQKNGKDLNEDVELRETLVNPDGNFQKRSILRVSPEQLNKNEYRCVVQHSSLEEEIVIKFNTGLPMGIIIGAVVAVLLLVIIGGVGFFIWRKKQSDFEPVLNKPPSEDSASGSSHSSELKEVHT